MSSKENEFGTYTDGHISFNYQGETFQTYYKLYGTLEGRTRTPLVVLHGGPSLLHDYLLPHADLPKKFSIPVIFYDQLGNGQSTHLKDKPNSFWSYDLFMDELNNLLKHFNIQDSFDILAHSAGACLALEYAIERQRPGLRRLVLANAFASRDLWVKSVLDLLKYFPPDVAEGIKIGMKDPAAHYEALKVFNAKHGCTVKPLPSEYTKSFDAIFGPNGDTAVARAAFHAKWSGLERLHKVKVITLIINGRFDIVQDYVCSPLFYKIPKNKWVRFEKSSHTAFWEERDEYIQVVGSFLTEGLDPLSQKSNRLSFLTELIKKSVGFLNR